MDIPTSSRACSVCEESLRGEEQGHHKTCQGASRRRRTVPLALPLLLTVNQVAEALRLSRSKVYEMVASGDLEAYRPGGRLRIAADAVARLLDRSRV